MNTKIPPSLFGIVEFAPIIVFGYLGSAAGVDLRERFLIGGGLALSILVAHRVIKWPMNSLALAANLFLLIEGAAFITYMKPVAVALGFVGESALFVVTFVVGVVRTLRSPRGFVDVESGEPSAIRRGSLYLALGTLVGLGMSIAFHGRYVWSATLPFVGLLFLRRVLRDIVRNSGTGAESPDTAPIPPSQLIRIEVTRSGHFNPVFKEAPHASQRV